MIPMYCTTMKIHCYTNTKRHFSGENDSSEATVNPLIYIVIRSFVILQVVLAFLLFCLSGV